MENQSYFDNETRELMEEIDKQAKIMLGQDYEKIEQEIKEERQDLEYLIS